MFHKALYLSNYENIASLKYKKIELKSQSGDYRLVSKSINCLYRVMKDNEKQAEIMSKLCHIFNKPVKKHKF